MSDTNFAASSTSLLYCSMAAGSQARVALPHTAVQVRPGVSDAYQPGAEPPRTVRPTRSRADTIDA
eukprot:scaffold39484_cov66-Phaeocystis_antarctica.AAC.1